MYIYFSLITNYQKSSKLLNVCLGFQDAYNLSCSWTQGFGLVPFLVKSEYDILTFIYGTDHQLAESFVSTVNDNKKLVTKMTIVVVTAVLFINSQMQKKCNLNFIVSNIQAQSSLMHNSQQLKLQSLLSYCNTVCHDKGKLLFCQLLQEDQLIYICKGYGAASQFHGDASQKHLAIQGFGEKVNAAQLQN